MVAKKTAAKPAKKGWFTKEYGGKSKHGAPQVQDTQRHFGRGSAPKTYTQRKWF